jgi:hypothetical protein
MARRTAPVIKSGFISSPLRHCIKHHCDASTGGVCYTQQIFSKQPGSPLEAG